MTQVWGTTACDEILATLLHRLSMRDMCVHPADLDCTQHLELLMVPAQEISCPRLPFAYDEVSLRQTHRKLSSVR